MSGNSEDGEGMEPPKSENDDEIGASDSQRPSADSPFVVERDDESVSGLGSTETNGDSTSDAEVPDAEVPDTDVSDAEVPDADTDIGNNSVADTAADTAASPIDEAEPDPADDDDTAKDDPADDDDTVKDDPADDDDTVKDDDTVEDDDTDEDAATAKDADTDEDADLLSVDEWLATAAAINSGAESNDATSGSLARRSTETDMADAPSDEISDIMAELLAAAEQSTEEVNAEAEVLDLDALPYVVDRSSDSKDAETTSVASSGDTSTTTKELDRSDTADSDKSAGDDSSDDRDASKNAPEKDSKSPADSESQNESDSESQDESQKDSGDGNSDTSASKATTAAALPATEIKVSAAGATPAAQRSVPIGVLFMVAVLGVYLLLALVSGLDSLRYRNEANRGVRIAETDVGGLNRQALDATTAELSDELRQQPLEITVGEVSIESDPVTLGLDVDQVRMADEALAARRGGFLLLRPIRWLGNFFSSYTVDPAYLVNSDRAARAAAAVIAPELNEPVEPTLEFVGDEMVANPGSPGVTIDAAEIEGRLPEVIEAGTPYRLQLTARDSNPNLDTEVVTEIAEEINQQTAESISIRVLDDQVDVSPRTQKSWIELVVDDDDADADWVVNEDLALDELKPLFPTLGSEDQQAKFTIVDGRPVILPASESVVCCEAGSAEDLLAAIKEPIPEPVEAESDDEAGSDETTDPEESEIQPQRQVTLEPIITGEDEGVAELESLGIIEEVSTFTTEHACCQNRVINIQQFADLTQGAIIRPGETFSLNDHVGQRTIAKGFVADGAISLGNFEQQVGGGISQYATTFFNAAFFAGIEFVEYQSHSIYISRYPRGREATISWRRPDLEVLNNTEYGILVWNEYTPTSITVTFYSTKHLEVEALPLRRSSERQCRVDITPRLITYEDGTTFEDSVRAIYRPGEGLDCNGNSTTPEEDPPPPEPEPEPQSEPEPQPEPEPDSEILPPGQG